MALSPIDQLIESFMKFPGIGPRQARRFVYYILRSNHSTIENLLRQISSLKDTITQCPSCMRFYPAEEQRTIECPICRDHNRDHASLMIVEKDVDLENIERTDTYNGYYFVLGGLVPILEKTPDRRIRSKELLDVVRRRSLSGLAEIILALSANPEGDYTAQYVRKLFSPLLEKSKIKISMLGRGLSTGTELEYSDSDTLKNALKHRE